MNRIIVPPNSDITDHVKHTLKNTLKDTLCTQYAQWTQQTRSAPGSWAMGRRVSGGLWERLHRTAHRDMDVGG